MIALQKKPEDRFATWRDFGNELAALGHFEKSDLEINENEKFIALRRLKFLHDFTDIELWELLRVGEWQKQPAKTVLLREGDLGDAFFILTDGGVTVTRNNKLLNTLSEGAIFGEMSYVSRKQIPRSASIVARTEVTVMKILPSQLNKLSDRCQLHFSQAFLTTLADRLRVSDDRVAKMVT
jgi:CRP-like cAMP-binding protein